MSVSLLIDGYSEETPRDLLSLSFLLSKRVLPIVQDQMTESEKELFQNTCRPDFIVPDGGYEFQNAGTMNMYLFGIPVRLFDRAKWEFTEAIRGQGLTHGSVSLEQSRAYGIPVFRAAISELPEVDAPPEVNITMTSAFTIMRALGLDSYRYEYGYTGIPVAELVLAATDLRFNDDHLQPTVINQSGGCTIITQGYDLERLVRLRDAFLRAAIWARDHGYQTLSIQ